MSGMALSAHVIGRVPCSAFGMLHRWRSHGVEVDASGGVCPSRAVTLLEVKSVALVVGTDGWNSGTPIFQHPPLDHASARALAESSPRLLHRVPLKRHPCFLLAKQVDHAAMVLQELAASCISWSRPAKTPGEANGDVPLNSQRCEIHTTSLIKKCSFRQWICHESRRRSHHIHTCGYCE